MKIFTKLVWIIFFFSITAFGQVTLPHYDSFNYTVGQALYNQAGWDSLNSGDDILISSANLSYPGFAAPSGNKISFDGTGIDVAKRFTQQTTGTVYYSFLLNIKSLGSLSTTGGYFAGFIQTTTSNFGATVWLKRFGSGFTIGINARTTTANTVWSTDTLSINKTYLIVASYQIVSGNTNDIVKLWLNPSSASFGVTEPSPTLSSTNTGTDLTSLDRILVRQDSNTETPFIELDELRIGTSWANVTPPVGISPLITVDPTGLENFTYVVGSGPSTSQIFSLTGSNLSPANGSITVKGSVNYEVSLDNSSFFSELNLAYTLSTISTTQIYVRLKQGLSAENYNNETVKNSGGGCDTIIINCSGRVLSTPPPPNLPIEENFDYLTGPLNGQGNWQKFSGIENQVQVLGGNLVYPGYMEGTSSGKMIALSSNNTEDIRMDIQDQSGAGIKVYASFLFKMDSTNDLTSNPTADNQSVFAGFLNGTNNFTSRIWARTDGAGYNLGISKDNTAASVSWITTTLNVETTYLIVINYEFVGGTTTDDLVKMWINPDLSGTEPTPGATATGTDIGGTGSIQYFMLREGTDIPNAKIDGLKIASQWSNAPLPVELSSFSASVVGNSVKLNWKTETEINNYGFDVERTSPRPSPYQGEGGEAGTSMALPLSVTGWEKIGFVNGNGNSNSPKSYSFTDTDVLSGKYSYRLKQIDNDGQFEYSKTIEVDLGAPTKFELSQNYPNPFNPTTKIKYTIPNVTLSVSSRAESRDEGSLVVLKVYDVLGNEVTTLVNEEKPAGVYEVEFSSVGLASGIYFYRIAIQSDKLQSGSFVETKKMIIMK